MACQQQKFIPQSFAGHQYLRNGTSMIKFWWKYYSSLQKGDFLKGTERPFGCLSYRGSNPILWDQPLWNNHLGRVLPSDTTGIYIFTCEICGGGYTFLPLSPKQGYFCWYNLVSIYFIALSWPLIRSSVFIEMFDYLSNCELLSWEPKL